MKEVALEGLERGRAVNGLEKKKSRGKGYGIFTRVELQRGKFICEYKYTKLLKSRKEYKEQVQDHMDNNEESVYILEIFVKGEKWYLDATRSYKTVGR